MLPCVMSLDCYTRTVRTSTMHHIMPKHHTNVSIHRCRPEAPLWCLSRHIYVFPPIYALLCHLRLRLRSLRRLRRLRSLRSWQPYPTHKQQTPFAFLQQRRHVCFTRSTQCGTSGIQVRWTRLSEIWGNIWPPSPHFSEAADICFVSAECCYR
jgi:hypothetical protein